MLYINYVGTQITLVTKAVLFYSCYGNQNRPIMFETEPTPGNIYVCVFRALYLHCRQNVGFPIFTEPVSDFTTYHTPVHVDTQSGAQVDGMLLLYIILYIA